MNCRLELENQGYALIKNVISQEFAYFLTHILLRKSEENLAQTSDDQVTNCLAILSKDFIFETLLEKLWPDIEYYFGEKLLPTYAYSRLYQNGNFMTEHKDREACEISMTIQLGRSHSYVYPIYMRDKEYLLNVGDGILYYGTEVEHSRKICSGPENYYSGQTFLHFVRENGKFASQAGDQKDRKTPVTFIKNRHFMF